MSQREILFKAKRTDNGEWVEGHLIEDSNNSFYITAYNFVPMMPGHERKTTLPIGCKHKDEWVLSVNVAVFKVDPETVCQYTGLTDKNRKKIFEGDVLSFYDDKPFTPWVAEVKWMHCEYYLDGVNRPSRVFLSDFLPEEMTITGNIHDN